MTSARLTISTASDRWRALRFNSRLSGGAKTTLPKLMPTNIQHTHNESLTYCTSLGRRPGIVINSNYSSVVGMKILIRSHLKSGTAHAPETVAFQKNYYQGVLLFQILGWQWGRFSYQCNQDARLKPPSRKENDAYIFTTLPSRHG